MTLLPWLLSAFFLSAYLFARHWNRVGWRLNRQMTRIADDLAREVTTLKQEIENRDATIHVLVSNIKSGKNGLDELHSYLNGEKSKLRDRENRFRAIYPNSQN